MQDLQARFQTLGTAPIADACVRLEAPMRQAPAGIKALIPGHRVAGRALPARHFGSVDIFLEAFSAAKGGEVMVIDNRGLTDEACIGDLTAMEAQSADVAALIVWGVHRDTRLLIELDCPVWSLGQCPYGPLSALEREEGALDSANCGDQVVTPNDYVFADEDGVLFVAEDRVEAVFAEAQLIAERERQQAAKVKAGENLREQLQFDEYLRRRASNPQFTLREFLREIAAEIES